VEGATKNADFEQESLTNLMENISDISNCGQVFEFQHRLSID
jgi:hypothetical protein